MYTINDQYGNALIISNFKQFQNFVDGIPDEKWNNGSGDICLLNKENGFYISISKIAVGDRFVITSAKAFGEELYVYVSNRRYTTTVECYIGGESTKFPSEFFVEKNFIYQFGSELIIHGSINFSENWVVLNQQEWFGMRDDF
ncbi:hypothetical protein F966_02817 [Acinetobacter higginsii]|uniref:Uncharacterized protein n=1 Tax=Acinetobacter higginsii TaxID=70347 RepID=N8W9E3_9GAMM|nr:hypothetical protein [Acinetobacter higginsii]ENV08702.1 hypothetical protein F966_02817 [Acinetobacter higginsii]